MKGNEEVRYDICDTCSNKFYVKRLNDEYLLKIDAKEKNIKELQEEFRLKKEKYKAIRNDYNQKKRYDKSLIAKSKKTKRETEFAINQYKNEKIYIINETEAATQELSKLQKNLGEIEIKSGELETTFKQK